MQRFRFPIAVAVTSLALVAVLGGVALLGVQAAFANGQFMHPFGAQLPPELQGLHDLPPAERFAHFVGAQFSVKDKNNNPLTVVVTPGNVTSVNSGTLTLAANDGTPKVFTLDSSTTYRSQGGQASQADLTAGDLVVVVTHNAETKARFVMDGNQEGFAPKGGHGPGGPFGPRFGPGR